MDEEIYIKVNLLKEKLKDDPRILRLNECEKKMDEDEEVMALAYKKDVAASKYSDVLNHFSKDSEEAQKALKELHEAKLNLDNHPVVREYLKAYQEVRELYDEINKTLFTSFTIDLCPKVK